MSASRIALTASSVAVVAWALKAIAIAIAGGLDRSPAEGPLFVVGLVAALVGAGAFGVALAEGRSIGIRVLAGAAGVVTMVLLSLGIGALVTAVQPADPSWVFGEVNLWVGALTLLGVVVWWHSRSRSPSRTAS